MAMSISVGEILQAHYIHTDHRKTDDSLFVEIGFSVMNSNVVESFIYLQSLNDQKHKTFRFPLWPLESWSKIAPVVTGILV